MNYVNAQHRYYYLDYYLREKYHCKVFKVALNGNFSCPNRDGSISTKGCLFCSEKGSGDFAGNPNDPLNSQFQIIKGVTGQKWKDAKYIAYFQANTNTYGPIEKIIDLAEQAIKLDPDIVAISLATRCDCLSEAVLNYLGMLNQRIPVWVELGLQTIHPETMEAMNLGYDLPTFQKAVNDLRLRNIDVIAHIIDGLPGETKAMMLETAQFLNSQDIQGLKIHSLFVLKNTPLGDEYLKKPFPILTMEEYVDIVSEQLAILNDRIVIHRVSGDAPVDDLIEPQWSTKKLVVMNEIDKAMKRKKYTQGCK
jgi:hypothetical protein